MNPRARSVILSNRSSLSARVHPKTQSGVWSGELGPEGGEGIKGLSGNPCLEIGRACNPNMDISKPSSFQWGTEDFTSVAS